MELKPEILEYFKNKNEKTEIVQRALPEIVRQLERSKKFGQDQGIMAIGLTFESLVVQEIIESQSQNETQNVVREIIKEMFEDTDMTLGKERVRKPDFVSVIFDKKGNLVIDEIIEAKTSQEAINHKTKEQAQGTIETIEQVVSLFNELNSAKTFDEFDIKKRLDLSKENSFRIKYLKNLYEKIHSLKLGPKQQITFSDHLSYHVIVEAGPKVHLPDLDLTIGSNMNKRRVSVWASQSRFNSRDVRKIIDNYSETPATKYP